MYFGVFFYKGYQFGISKREKLSKEKTYLSTTKQLEEMKPVAREHWNRSQELFKQMRDVQNNPAEVKKLNDENISEINKALEIEPGNPRIWAMHIPGSAIKAV